MRWTGSGGTQQSKRRVGGNAIKTKEGLEEMSQKGSGPTGPRCPSGPRMAKATSTTTQDCHHQHCSRPPDAPSLRASAPQQCAQAPPRWRVDNNDKTVAATKIPRTSANDRTEVVKMVGVWGIQASTGDEGAGGARRGGGCALGGGDGGSCHHTAVTPQGRGSPYLYNEGTAKDVIKLN